MGLMNNLLCLPLFVFIFILDSLVNAKGENVQTYSTKAKYNWFQVRNECSLVGNESTTIDIPNLNSDLRWTGYSARYLPWVEYLGCFGLKADKHLVLNRTHVEKGKQLIECLLHCKQSTFIGLQQSHCVCLGDLMVTTEYIENPCNAYPAKCLGDQNAFCGKLVETGYSLNAFSIYQKANVTERVKDGNCLAVDRKKDSFNYKARDCAETAFQICLNGSVQSTAFVQQYQSNRTWIDSFTECPKSFMLARYSLEIDKGHISRMGTFWLSNTRRWIQGTFTNPAFCIAARVKQDGHIERFLKRCVEQLPGMCVRHELTPTVTITEVSQYPGKISDHEKKMTSPDDATPINKVLLISVIAATSLTILVAIVIVIICIRMKRIQSNSSKNQIVVDGKNAVYAQVDRSVNQDRTTNQTTGQSPVEDTYDHMDHRCLNQMLPKEESNYDTMSKVGIVEENDYSHTNETERERQCFVDASSEYSHVTVVAKPKTID